MKMVNFHRFRNFRLEFQQCLKKKLSKSSNFTFLPLKIFVFVVVGLNSADDVWSLFCDAFPPIPSASLLKGLSESEFYFCGVFPTIGSLLLGGRCVVMSCG